MAEQVDGWKLYGATARPVPRQRSLNALLVWFSYLGRVKEIYHLPARQGGWSAGGGEEKRNFSANPNIYRDEPRGCG